MAQLNCKEDSIKHTLFRWIVSVGSAQVRSQSKGEDYEALCCEQIGRPLNRFVLLHQGIVVPQQQPASRYV
ncbi:MAG: hypothetical protein HRU26_07105 [Psychroserpens sp.]|nr:hypothetical protein [Psychroserpens sp.]